MSRILIAVFIMLGAMSLDAQTFGVRAGLNYSTFLGPLETGPNVDERYTIGSGFHFGLSYAYDVTDIFSVRAEIVYLQNGSRYSYEGDSYYIIRTTDDITYERGETDYELNISNANLSIPIMANFRVSNKWELFGGPYINILFGPTARGNLRFESSENPDDIVFRQSLDFRYANSDTDQTIGRYSGGFSDIGIFVNGSEVTLPRFAGAYTQYGIYPGNKYNLLDFGLTAGAHYFLNKGFFIGFQVDYGLRDITDNSVDVSISELTDDNLFILKDDKDTNLSFHASFGFRF